MIFLHHTYLWALLGLTIPLAIHLWSKKEGRTIKIGSIQLLSTSNPKQTSNIKLNELWLLLLRMLLISLLVLILAEPRVRKSSKNVPLIYIFEPSLLSYDKVNAIIDTLKPGTSIRLLEPGFPELKKNELQREDIQTPDYWQLANEMDVLLTDSIVVFTSAFLSGIKGMRPQVNGNINWIVLDPGKPKKGVIEVLKKENELQLMIVTSDHQSLTFKQEIVPENSSRIEYNEGRDSVRLISDRNQRWLCLDTANSRSVLIVYADSLNNEKKYIQSSLQAISKYLDRPIRMVIKQDVDSVELISFDLVVWLSEKPTWQTSVPLLVYKPDPVAQAIIEQGPDKNIFHLTSPLNAENIIDEHLPERLLDLLYLHQGLDEKIRPYDVRVMDNDELWPVNSDVEKDRKNAATLLDISKWLWVMLFVLIISERALARYRKQ